MYKLLAAAIAASATALPATSGPVSPPLSNAEFGLIMDVSQTSTPNYVSLNAAKQDGTDQTILIGQRLSVYPGTPAYLVGPNPGFRSLNLDIDGCQHGLFAPGVGETGVTTLVAAKEVEEFFDWTTGTEGSIYHRSDAATNQFLACNTTVGGQTYLALAWGNAAPEGCFPTHVKQNCNMNSEATCGN